MYQYDDFDQAMVDARVEEFRDQARRRMAGALTDDQFKPLRLMNGLYLQLHAYMLRVAIPYGKLSSKQMHMLATIARIHDRVMAISPRVRTSSITGSSWKMRQIFWPISRRCKCMPFKPAAIASATSAPTNMPELQPTR